jgi:hypothetical protein
VVAKLLYLSSRARLEIIMAVVFLCTMVQGPTEEERMKLRHLLGYLLKTRKKVLELQPSRSFKVTAYIDVSSALHNDGKSHTGIIMFVGGVAVFCASRKQKCVSKSSTEAELVVLSNNLGCIELFYEFIPFIANGKVEIPLIYQDNTSVITMVTSGGGIMQTKQMRSRIILVLESLKKQRVTICYIHTSGMIADGLTKPIKGKDFDYFVRKVLGFDKKSTGGH